MKKIALILAIVALAAANTAFAQHSYESNSIFYHSIRSPQSLDENPALWPAATKVFVTLPHVGLNFGSPLSLSDMLSYTPGDTVTYIDLNKITEQLTKNNAIRLGANFDILGFGFKVGHEFFTANLKLKSNLSLGIPVQAINSLMQGNVDEDGNPITSISLLDGQLMDIQAYLETSIGYGHHFEDLGLTVGAKAKLYGGLANINTANTHIDLQTSDDFESMTANAYYQLSMASVVGIEQNSDSTYNMVLPSSISGYLPKSTGLGFDLGGKYKLGPVTLSASVLDISRGIYWDQNVYTVTPKGGSTAFEFSGLDFESGDLLDSNGINFDTLTNALSSGLDSLNANFADGQGYWHSVPTKFNLGASIGFLRICKAGLLIHGQWDRGLFSKKEAVDYDNQNFRFNTTLSASVNLKNWLELTVANGFISDGSGFTIFNPGIAITLAPATALQISLVADYVSSIYVVEARSLNLLAGINLVFGSNRQ